MEGAQMQNLRLLWCLDSAFEVFDSFVLDWTLTPQDWRPLHMAHSTSISLSSQLANAIMLKLQGLLHKSLPSDEYASEPRLRRLCLHWLFRVSHGQKEKEIPFEFMLCHFTGTQFNDTPIAIIEVKLRAHRCRSSPSSLLSEHIFSYEVPSITIAGNIVAVVRLDPTQNSGFLEEYNSFSQAFLNQLLPFTDNYLNTYACM